MSLLHIYLLLVSAAIGLVLALIIASRALAPGAGSLIVFVLAASVWSFGYALEFLSPDLPSKLFWAKFQYFGIAAVAPAWFIFTHRYLRAGGIPGRMVQSWIGLAIVPVLTILLVWTNDSHRQVWDSVSLDSDGLIQILEIHHGPWFWITLIYSYILMVLGTLKLGKTLLSSVRLHRWQTALGLAAILVPWLGNLIYVTRLSPVEHLDLTPFGFTVAGLFFTISLVRFQFAKIQPIAQQAVFDGLADSIVVLDPEDRVVDLNPAARAMAQNNGGTPYGKPFAEIFPDFARWIEHAAFREGNPGEFALGEGPEQRFYDLQTVPLAGPGGHSIGRLVVGHDITQLKQQQRSLELARDHLEQAVAERTAELQSAVEQVERELAERTFAEKRFETVVESVPFAILLIDQHGAIRLVNAQAEQLFGYTRAELIGQNITSLIPTRNRKNHVDYLEKFFADPSAVKMDIGLDSFALSKDGCEFPVEISLAPFTTAGGLWVVCNVQDISKRKQAESEQLKLLDELRQSHERLRLMAIRLEEVQEIERRQIASELHDRVGQSLTALNLNLKSIENKLALEPNILVRSRLADSLDLVEETTRQVRNVMAELNPPMLDEYGLLPALRWYGQRFSDRTGIRLTISGDSCQTRPPHRVEAAVYRIIQEALNNVAKHAQATEVTLTCESNDRLVCITLEDDGLGFDPDQVDANHEEPHWGLLTMKERTRSVGGRLTIDSTPGKGTRLAVQIRRTKDGDHRLYR